MKSMINRYLHIFIFFFVFGNVNGQTLQAYIKEAEKAFLEKDYYNALDFYQIATEFDSTRIDLFYRVGESAQSFNAYNIAETNYQRVLDMDSDGKYPLAVFHLADVKQNLGKYQEATDLYNLYLSESENENPYYTVKAKMEITSSAWAQEQMAIPNPSITIEKVAGVNTPFTEFGGVMMDSMLYFSSLRFEAKKNDKLPFKLISKVLKAEKDSSGVLIDGDFNDDQLHTAHIAFNKDHTSVYYTKCEYLKGSDIRCDLYKRSVGADGKFTNEIKLPDTINVPGYTTTQPSIRHEKGSAKEYLYFVSDRKGGKGKLDIWQTEILANDQYGGVENVNKINTPEDDITPFYHEASSTLFFSSKGYQGYGGFDIYRSTILDTMMTKPSHLIHPINSSFNDIYYTLDAKGQEAYYSSNRVGSFYIDEGQEACCYDIYHAHIEPVEILLDALTFDKFDGSELLGATVTIIDMDADTIVEKILSPDSNSHTFKLESGKNYQIIGSKDPYTADTILYSTHQIFESQDVIKKLFLDLDKVNLDITTFDKETQEALKGATITLIDLSDENIADVIKVNELGNNFNFDLVRGRNYKIIAQRDGYKDETFIIDGSTIPIDGVIKKKIFFEKKDLNIYLPLTLYFDNDRPSPKSLAITTAKTYTDTYHPYMGRRELYQYKTALSLSGEQRSAAEQLMQDFFEFEVQGGFEKMQLFLNALITKMKEGYEFEILIKGHASPLASDRYNDNLSKRRVNSIHNELKKYAGDTLDEFLNSGQLKITDVSYGEKNAPSSVSDSPSNTRKSIYSIEASRERRVEILRINEIKK